MSENKTLFQQGTLGALMAGLYDGTLTIRELLEHGNTGIGTMDALDGELIIIDGEAYQAKSDGSFKKLSGLEKVPYAAVTYFDAERDYEINKTMTASQVKELIEFELSSLNSFSAVKIKGHFKQIHVRNVPKQNKPYPRLIDVSKNQPEYQETEMDGTIIGFYTPALFQGAAAAGFHLHFINDQKTFGGHVLDFVIERGQVEIETIETLEQHFQIYDATFMETEFDDSNLHKEIELAES